MVNSSGINGVNSRGYLHYRYLNRIYRYSRSSPVKDPKYSIHEINI